jgi:hypothetical protein
MPELCWNTFSIILLVLSTVLRDFIGYFYWHSVENRIHLLEERIERLIDLNEQVIHLVSLITNKEEEEWKINSSLIS